MGRFDALKENTFTSKKNTSPKNNKKEPRRRRNKQSNGKLSDGKQSNGKQSNGKQDVGKQSNGKQSEIIKSEIISKTEEKVVEKKEESKWIKAIKEKEKEKEKELFTLNANDPIYWKNGRWVGPVMLRQNKFKDPKYDQYLKEATNKASCIIMPYTKTEYSRDGKKWCNSFKETFTQRELEQMDEEAKYNESLRISNAMQELYNRWKKESDEHYEITGELDGFAIAELELEKYEKYARQFDEQLEEVEEEDDGEYSDYLDEEY